MLKRYARRGWPLLVTETGVADSPTLSATIFFRPAKPAFESTCMQIDPDPSSSALWLPT